MSLSEAEELELLELEEQEYQASKSSAKPESSTRDIVGSFARPLLEGGGAIAGGVLGSPMGPVGAVGGGALGYGIGKSAADLLDRGLGRKAPIPNMTEAVKEAGGNAYEGAQMEGIGLGASKVIPPILKAAGRVRNVGGEWATGIPSKDFQSLANNPMSMKPGTLAKAGEKFGRAEANAGISSELTPEAVDRIRSPGKYAFDTFNKLKTEGAITAQEALHGRQSIDAVYPVPNKKNGSYIRTLDQIRDAFQEVIANTTPELKEASKDYAIAKAGSRFQSILPQNKSGTPSFIRGGTMIAGIMSGNPGAAVMSPAVAGTATAATGAAGGAVKRILRDGPGRRMLFGGASSLLRPKPESESRVVNPANSVPQALNANANGGNQQNGVKNGSSDFNQASPKKLLGQRVAKGDILTDSGQKSRNSAPSIFAKRTKPLTKADVRRFLDMANGDRDLAKRIAKKEGFSW